MSSPRDLGPFLEPVVGDEDYRRQLRLGRRRWRSKRLKRALAVMGAGATAVAGGVLALRPAGDAPAVREPEQRSLEHVLRTPVGTGPAGSEDDGRAPGPPQLVARPSDAFMDSLGIHVRLNYEAYRNDIPLVRQRLQALGIRHVFDVSRTRLAALRALGELGIRAHVVVQEGSDPERVARELGPVLASVQADWRFGQDWRQGLLDAAWARKARRFAQELSQRVRGSSSFAHVALLGPSVRYPYESAAIGDLSAWSDVGALNYWSAPMPPGGHALDEELTGQRRVFPGQELVITQGGYSTAALSVRSVSEVIQAKYLLRMYAECFSRGVLRTFANQLLDFSTDRASPDSGLGLLRMDGTPKPAFPALQALIAAVADEGPPFVARPLRLGLEGAPEDLRHLLLHKRDERYLLLAWLARPATDEGARVLVTVRLGSRARSVTAAGSTLGTDTDRFSMPVTDGVSVVEIAP